MSVGYIYTSMSVCTHAPNSGIGPACVSTMPTVVALCTATTASPRACPYVPNSTKHQAQTQIYATKSIILFSISYLPLIQAHQDPLAFEHIRDHMQVERAGDADHCICAHWWPTVRCPALVRSTKTPSTIPLRPKLRPYSALVSDAENSHNIGAGVCTNECNRVGKAEIVSQNIYIISSFMCFNINK